MDNLTLSFLHTVLKEVQGKHDWKASLDTLFTSLRGSFVFDNVVIFLEDARTKSMDIVYARAMGRGKTAEADAAWGENVAMMCSATKKMVLKEPKHRGQDRMDQPHLLGMPLYIGSKIKWRARLCSLWRSRIFRFAY
jgi:hypothetical protein